MAADVLHTCQVGFPVQSDRRINRVQTGHTTINRVTIADTWPNPQNSCFPQTEICLSLFIFTFCKQMWSPPLRTSSSLQQQHLRGSWEMRSLLSYCLSWLYSGIQSGALHDLDRNIMREIRDAPWLVVMYYRHLRTFEATLGEDATIS